MREWTSVSLVYAKFCENGSRDVPLRGKIMAKIANLDGFT